MLHPDICKREFFPEVPAILARLAEVSSTWPPGTAMRIETAKTDGSMRFHYFLKVSSREGQGKSWDR